MMSMSSAVLDTQTLSTIGPVISEYQGVSHFPFQYNQKCNMGDPLFDFFSPPKPFGRNATEKSIASICSRMHTMKHAIQPGRGEHPGNGQPRTPHL